MSKGENEMSDFDRSEPVADPYRYPSLKDYVARVQNTHGSILQLNRIGALTVVTAYRSLGEFETVLWDSRLPNWRDIGILVSHWSTLEVAEAFHFAYTRRIYASVFGGELRKMAAYMAKPAREAMSEITIDEDLHLFEDEDPWNQ
jgi:hypothetical protein